MTSPDISHSRIAEFVKNGVIGEVRSVSIIGSYLINERVREGSDIDLVVVVGKLGLSRLQFEEIFYKDVEIQDSMGERREVNVKFDDTPLDVTVIDSFNTPNNPLTDNYENAIGSFQKALPIYGRPLREIFDLEKIVEEYGNIKEARLAKVIEKIELTKRKIIEQERKDLHIIYELQRYIFIRECIMQSVFNFLSIKHPDLSIPNFDVIFQDELLACGIEYHVNQIPNKPAVI